MEYPRYDHILLDPVSDAPILKLVLNRPEKLNAVTHHMMHELEDALGRIKQDPGYRVVILKGAGRAFSTGHDFKDTAEHGGYASTDHAAWERWNALEHIERWHRLFWGLPQVIITQVHGYAITLGATLAMMGDIVVASDDVRIAARPIHGTSRLDNLWPITVGLRMTMELLLTGDYVTGKQAAELRMINRSVPLERLDAEVDGLARAIAKQPLEFIALQKSAIYKFYEAMGLRNALERATEIHAVAHSLQRSLEADRIEKTEGMQAALNFRDSVYGGKHFAGS